MSPSLQRNPRFVLFDTSVLLPMIATDQVQICRLLRQTYDVQAVIVPAVHSEAETILRKNPKFVGRQEQLRKAVEKQTIRLIELAFLRSHFGETAETLLKHIDSEGQRLHVHVDRGEAYTHAAAVALRCPVATNDTSAVRRLIRDGEAVPRPILRFWDIVVLARQTSHLDDAQCDRIRTTLERLEQNSEQAFRNHSFAAALPHFFGRLMDGDAPPIGAASPQIREFDERLVLTRSTATSAEP